MDLASFAGQKLLIVATVVARGPGESDGDPADFGLILLTNWSLKMSRHGGGAWRRFFLSVWCGEARHGNRSEQVDEYAEHDGGIETQR